jgi:hypothetical protein
VKSRTHRRFWDRFDKLPADVQVLAREKFQIWKHDAFHPLLHFKRLTGDVWSVESETAIALSHVDMVISSCGFGSAPTKSTTISLISFARIDSQSLGLRSIPNSILVTQGRSSRASRAAAFARGYGVPRDACIPMICVALAI